MKTGETVTHYRIDAPLGKGGMGVVYLATDMGLNRRVAIKFSVREDDAERLAAEARAASRLDHPNIARIYALDRTGEGRPFFVMEYAPGRSLAEMLAGQPLGQDRAVEILRAVCEALAHAHERGVVHRDIKPANIQITDTGRIKVLDFGIAGRLRTAPEAEADLTLTLDEAVAGRGISGSPGYMSPEQAAGHETDHRTDLFSLGCVFYECLTGRRPFPARQMAEYFAELHGQSPDAPSSWSAGIPEKLDGIALRLLSKNREDRFQRAAEVLAALDGAEAPAAPVTPVRLALWRVPWRLAGIAFLCLAAALAAWLWPARAYVPKPEALQWYKQGLEAARDGTYLKASRALAEAARLDPEFIMARAHLAEAWSEMDYGDRARQEMLRMKRMGGALSRLRRLDRLRVEAIDFAVTGDLKEAVLRYQSMLGLAKSAEKAGVYLDLGRAFERAGESERARESLERAIQTEPQGAAGYLRLGLLLRRAREYSKAEAAFVKASRLYQAASNIEGVTEVKYGLGMLQADREHPEEAKKLLEDALKSARLTGSTQQQVKILLQLATLNTRSGAPDEVRALAAEAVDLARAEGVENLASRALIILGGALFVKDKAQAERYFATALESARRNRAELTEARALLSLGSLHGSMGRPLAAAEELRPAAQYFQRAGYPADAFQASVLLGRTQRDLGDYEGAEKLFMGLLPAAEKSGSNEETALLREGTGQVLMCKGEYRAAAKEFEASAALYEAASSALGVAYLRLSRAGALWRLGDYSGAAALLDEEEARAERSGITDLSRSARMERLQMALSQGRFQEARALAARLKAEKTPQTARDEVNLAVWEAVSLGNTGQAGTGLKTCREALAKASDVHIQMLKTNALLACAQVAALAGEKAQAIKWAGEVRATCRRSGQLEAEWMAGAVMARAGAPEAGAQAADALARMKQRWEAADLSRYLKRPDVRLLETQMTRMEKR